MAGEFTGAYVSPSVGCRMAVSSRVGINLSAGYTYMKTGYASKAEARRAVQQGGVAVDGEKVSDIQTAYSREMLSGDGLILKKGKKNFRKVVLK